MHSPQILSDVLQSLPIQPITGTVFRAVNFDALMSRNPPNALWSGGAREKGQRYTPPGGPDCLYVSETEQTALSEARGLFSTITNESTLSPLVALPIQVSLENVLDLTQQNTQQLLGTDLTELTSSWQMQMLNSDVVPTHVLAEAAFATHHFQAIRFPSAQVVGQVNLVIWTGLLKEPSFVEILDRNSKLWRRIP